MKRMRTVVGVILSLVLTVMLGGCGASYQARSVDLNATLVNPSLLKPGADDQALYRYAKPNIDMTQYTKVFVEPVLVRKDGQLDKDEQENYQKLANNAFVFLTQELEKDYQIVKLPEPGAMRIQMAITDADSASPVRLVTSSILPVGVAISLVKYGATGKQTAVGDITVEMRITDAGTGELLGAALDRRVGGKSWKGVSDKWYSADEALKYWAQRTRFALCETRGGKNCVKPE